MIWGGLTVRELLIGCLLLLQLPAVLVLLARLFGALGRLPPLQPVLEEHPRYKATVSVVIPTLNEGSRIGPCLAGVEQQGAAVREILVVDSRSQDDTVAQVLARQRRDPRFRVLTDPPLPPDWIGRPWALHYGFLASDPDSEWILGLDADTRPQPGLVNALLREAERGGWELLTLAPRFLLEYPGEAWLQPALLLTLIYRFGAAGGGADAERMMANGQCMLVRRRVLERLGGYRVARQSFCDDVTLVRAAARQGVRVGFLDGAQVLQVRMYTSLGETWREWGRSLALKDGAPPGQVLVDGIFLLLVMGLPLPLLTGWVGLQPWTSDWILERIAWFVNLGLVGIRWGMLLAIRPSYQRPPWTFWLSPLADPLASARILISLFSRPKRWRGRIYA
ncbi:MAG: glycosyltransferase family 2 protein [Thermostichales cyanobacterium HHBFW_bins_127]